MELANLLSFSNDLRYAYLTIAKVDSPVGKNDIMHALELNQMKGAFVYEDLFTELIANIRAENRYLDEIEKPEKILIAERRDASFETIISDDGLTVTLSFIQAYAGKGITFEQIMHDLNQKNVKYGIREETIKSFLSNSESVLPGQNQSIVIAHGTPCQDGADAYFECIVKADDVFDAKIDEDSGKVDMRHSYNMLTVLEGEPLMRLHPATQGKDGVDVFGGKIEPTPGRSLSFKMYEGARLNKEDPNLLEAEIGGQPKIFIDGASVLNVLNLKTVDLHSGNIDFDGSIVVLGDVEPKMSITVTGDLDVKGTIEDAVIDVKGDLTVGKGIIGKKNIEMEELSCMIKAGGEVHSNFAQYAHIESKKDISIQSYISNCEIITDGKLSVSNSTHTAGTIMGGTVCADRGIEAMNIGTSADVTTHCEVFAHYIDLQKKLSLELERQEEYKNALYKLFLIKKKLKSVAAKVNQEKRESDLEMIAHNEMQYNKLIHESKEISDKLQAQMKEDEETIDMKVYGHLYPGARLTIGAHRLSVKDEEISIRYHLDDGKLVVEAL